MIVVTFKDKPKKREEELRTTDPEYGHGTGDGLRCRPWKLPACPCVGGDPNYEHVADLMTQGQDSMTLTSPT